MHITEITPKIHQRAEKIRLAPYCRVSSDSADQLHSFAAQIRYYSEYERRNPEYQLVDIYADEGLTGTEMDRRDELNRLLRDCKKGKIDRIIVKSISRFARNTEELLVTLRMLKDIGVSVFFEEQGIDTNKLNSEMIVTFPGMIAQQESENISGNIRWGIRKQMESGDYICRTPAYGYEIVDGEMVVCEAEAKVVRYIFDMYLQGHGTPTITKKLNEQGILRRYGRAKWYNTTVSYILSNERYIGDALLQKKYRSEDLARRTLRNNGIKQQYYVENNQPPIISKELFYKVQELTKARSTEKHKRGDYPLKGIMRCPDCNRVFRRQLIRGKAYWMCSKVATGDGECKSRRVREDMVYDCFTNMIYRLKDNREKLLEALIQRLDYLQSKTSANHERIRQIDKEIADLSAKNLVITRLHSSGVLNASDYTLQTSEIGNKISELRIERRKKLNEDENDAVLEALKDLNEIIKEYIPQPKFNLALFEQLIEKIIVDDNTKITFCLLGGLRLTEEIREKGRCKTT